MKISSLSQGQLAQKLFGNGLTLLTPPFSIRIQSNCPALARDLLLGYGDFTYTDDPIFCDFHLAIKQEFDPLHWLTPVARFYFDGRPSFTPLPAQQAFTMLEWGLNWCIAAHCHHFLIIHAAVIERNGLAILMPAPPGSGKSTLCAALVNRGWRLLSDELALLDMQNNLVYGMARPVNLKNNAIEVIRKFAPEAQLTVEVPDTAKGKISLMRPTPSSVERVLEPARPRWLILPQYVAGSETLLTSANRAEMFMLIAEQSFNYDIHCENGFHRVGRLIDDCTCLNFKYSNLDEAIETFEQLASGCYGN